MEVFSEFHDQIIAHIRLVYKFVVFRVMQGTKEMALGQVTEIYPHETMSIHR